MFRSSLAIAGCIRREHLPSGVGVLDRLLPGGGIPIGALSELTGRRSCGKRALATACCAGVIARGRRAAWVDGCGSYYPLSALERLPLLEQLIVVRLPREQRRRWLLKAADILLQSAGAIALLVIDLPSHVALQPSAPQLTRLQRAAERSGTAVIFVTEQRRERGALGSLIDLRLAVRPHAGTRRALEVAIVKSKQGQMGASAEVSIDEPHGVRLDSTARADSAGRD